MFNILLSVVEQERLITAIFETFYLLIITALIAFPLGSLIGFILVFYGKNGVVKRKVLTNVLATSINIVRSIPFILLMVIIIPISYTLFGVSIGVIPSIISLSIIGTATVARSVSQSIVDLNPYLYDLAQSMGASKYQLFTHFILKEGRASLVLGYTSSLISILAYSTVLYIIDGGGLGFTAIQIGYYSPVGSGLMWASVITMILIVQVIQVLGTLLSGYLNKKKRGIL